MAHTTPVWPNAGQLSQPQPISRDVMADRHRAHAHRLRGRRTMTAKTGALRPVCGYGDGRVWSGFEPDQTVQCHTSRGGQAGAWWGTWCSAIGCTGTATGHDALNWHGGHKYVRQIKCSAASHAPCAERDSVQ